MAANQLPYVTAYGNITKALDGIKKAATPERFTQDFLASRLGLKGGTPKPVIPFLKRTGFLGSDGTPSERYKQFRNDANTGAAAAQALREGFAPLYEINEKVHQASDEDLRGLIVQVTGADKDSSTVQAILGSFKALRAYANFKANIVEEVEREASEGTDQNSDERGQQPVPQLNLGYTINLHLPATSDIAVFNAIFRSLRENLLK